MTKVQGKRVLVVGLARTGLAAARVLARHGAAVTVSDARPPWELRADIGELLASKIGMELGLHREQTFLRQNLIVVSPGVLPDMPQLQAARARNIPVVSEVEAASWFLKAPIIGITGSNGKTTTTALLGEILEASAFPTFVGGNIGVPLISAVGEVPDDALVVTELSSFQLEATVKFRPLVAVMLNITPNHLDRHPSLEAYIQAKARIFANQTSDDFAILNADDPAVMALAPAIAARKFLFSRQRDLPEGLFVEDGHIVYRVGNLERVLMTTKEIALRGEFNVENVLAAAAAACVVGADFEAIRRGVAAFRGVEHRLEFVREIRGVQFFNDSKATSVDAAAKALSAFDGGVHLILGGKDKGAPYAPIRKLLDGRARAVYLIGAAAERIGKQLAGTVALHPAGDLETALREAFARAVPGDIVLLSPACASFDQFQDYEQRGQVFKHIVERLSELPEKSRLGSVGAVASANAPFVQSEAPESHGAAVETPARTSAPHSSNKVKDEPVPETAPIPVADTPGTMAKLEARNTAESAVLETPTPTPNPESQAPSPESRNSNPERVYVYEMSAEEAIFPETDFVAARGDEEERCVNLDAIVAPEPVTDQALPFEIRPKPIAAATTTAVAESVEGPQPGVESGNGQGRKPPGGQEPA